MTNFVVGQRVFVNGIVGGANFFYEIGTIVQVGSATADFLIRFDNWKEGHDGGQICSKNQKKSFWWVPRDTLFPELSYVCGIQPTVRIAGTPIIKIQKESMIALRTLTNTIKKYLNKDIQALYQLEWVDLDDGEMSLTEKGETNLLEYLALEHPEISKSFGSFAKEKVAELKKEE